MYINEMHVDPQNERKVLHSVNIRPLQSSIYGTIKCHKI